MRNLLVGLAFAAEAVIFGLIAFHFAYRTWINHLGHDLRWRVFWLACLFGSQSIIAIERVRNRVTAYMNPGEGITLSVSPWFLAMVILATVSGLGFWLSFRHSLNEAPPSDE